MIKTFETIINEFEPQNPYQLLLGYDEEGRIHSHDLFQDGHLLMSGTTGSGKSVVMENMVLSLMMQHTPETLEVTLYDPKKSNSLNLLNLLLFIIILQYMMSMLFHILINYLISLNIEKLHFLNIDVKTFKNIMITHKIIILKRYPCMLYL